MMACEVLHDLIHLFPQLLSLPSSRCSLHWPLSDPSKAHVLSLLKTLTRWLLCPEHFSPHSFLACRLTAQPSTHLTLPRGLLSVWVISVPFSALSSIIVIHIGLFVCLLSGSSLRARTVSVVSTVAHPSPVQCLALTVCLVNICRMRTSLLQLGTP